MTTRKIIISNEYLRLCKTIDNILDKHNILFNIEDHHDFTDLIYMFNIYFMDCNISNYKEKIDNLLNIGSIELSEQEKNLVYNPIYDFVLWYKNLH